MNIRDRRRSLALKAGPAESDAELDGGLGQEFCLSLRAAADEGVGTPADYRREYRGGHLLVEAFMAGKVPKEDLQDDAVSFGLIRVVQRSAGKREDFVDCLFVRHGDKYFLVTHLPRWGSDTKFQGIHTCVGYPENKVSDMYR